MTSAAPVHLQERARRRVHAMLDAGHADPLSALIHRGLIAMVVLSVAAVVLETDVHLWDRWSGWFIAIETICVAIFTLEFGLRLWSAPEHTPWAHLHPWGARLAFASSVSGLIDLLSILPFYLALLVPGDFKILLLLRLLRFFKLARYSPGMRSLIAALNAEKRALFASAIVLFGLVLVTAAAMHLAEQTAQPDKFGSIPEAMWWAIVTLTTVGYGDVVPVTAIGRIIAGFTMLMGLMMLALPIGIVSTAFAEEIHRREFVVTWGMLARVPLFTGLAAADIAEVMSFLRAQTVPANTIIVRRGDPATGMYFIAAGAVEVEASVGKITLGEGQFFGEMALLRQSRRNATVRSKVATKLLALDARDLQSLMDRNEEIRGAIEAIAKTRASAGDQSSATPEPWSDPES